MEEDMVKEDYSDVENSDSSTQYIEKVVVVDFVQETNTAKAVDDFNEEASTKPRSAKEDKHVKEIEFLAQTQNEMAHDRADKQLLEESTSSGVTDESLKELELEEIEQLGIKTIVKCLDEPIYLKRTKSEIIPEFLAQLISLLQGESFTLALEENSIEYNDSLVDTPTVSYLFDTETTSAGMEMEMEEITAREEEDVAEIANLEDESSEINEISKDSEFRLKLVEDDELLIWLEGDEEREAPNELTTSTEAIMKECLEQVQENVTEETPEFDWLAYKRAQQLKQITSDTVNFLNELIAGVVQKCEYNSPLNMLRQSLDKAELMKDIIQKLVELEVEQKTRSFLNKRVADSLHRKGKYRVFTEENPDQLDRIIQRYTTSLIKLDRALGSEEGLKEKLRLQTSELERKLSLMATNVKEKLEEWKKLVRETFANKGEHLTKIVASQMSMMETVSEEISTTRYLLIQKQHCRAVLSEKLGLLDHLGNNIHLNDYQSLLKEVQQLEQKVEERNNGLRKTRERFNANMQIRAHTMEKQTVLRYKLDVQKSMLEQLQEDKKTARDCLSNLRRERMRLRNEIKDVRFQSSVLEKQELMRDYDVTEEQVKKTADNVKILRKQHHAISCKIAELEKKSKK